MYFQQLALFVQMDPYLSSPSILGVSQEPSPSPKPQMIPLGMHRTPYCACHDRPSRFVSNPPHHAAPRLHLANPPFSSAHLLPTCGWGLCHTSGHSILISCVSTPLPRSFVPQPPLQDSHCSDPGQRPPLTSSGCNLVSSCTVSDHPPETVMLMSLDRQSSSGGHLRSP